MKKLYLLTLLSILLTTLTGCKRTDTIVIGFSATLSGSNSMIGIQEMYGAELAVAEINAQGGIDGREVVLEIRDDLNDSAEAVKLDKELIEAGAVAIIGHGFSSVAAETVENANVEDYLLLSPSIGTDSLTAKDDNFIRLVPTASYEARTIAELMLSEHEGTLMIVYDKSNIALTEHHNKSFKEVMEQYARDFVSIGYTPSNIDDYNSIIESIQLESIESVLMVGSSLDASNIIQLIENEDIEIEYHLSAWASSGDILQRVGTSTSDIILYNFYNDQDVDAKHLEIRNNFFDRYGMEMTMVASYAYDAVMVLKEALSQIDDYKTETIKEEIIHQTYDGVQAPFSIDRYGDVERQIHQFIIVDGEIVIK